MRNDSSEEKRCRFPRFGLMTLILLISSTASGFGLWWRWEPWVLEHSSKQASLELYGIGLNSWSVDRLRVVGNGHIWNIRNSMKIASLKGANSMIARPCFSPDGEHILTEGPENIVQLRDAETGKVIESVNIAGPLLFMLKMPDGKALITGSMLGDIQVTDLKTKKTTIIIKGLHPSYQGLGVALAPDGSQIAFPKALGKMAVWDLRKGEMLATFNLASKMAGITDATFSSDGSVLLGQSADSKVYLWKIASRKLLKVLNPNGGRLVSSSFSDNNQHIICSDEDGAISLWDVRSGTLLTQLESGIKGTIGSVVTPDGQRIIQVGRRGEVTIYHRRRPEYSWGIVQLFEFWVTLILVPCLLWSLRRDWRILELRRQRRVKK